ITLLCVVAGLCAPVVAIVLAMVHVAPILGAPNWFLAVFAVESLLLMLPIAVALAAMMPFGILGLLYLVVAGLAMLPFGRELSMCGFGLDVSAEVLPESGSRNIELFLRADEGDAKMSHFLHADARVRQRIGEWIQERLESCNTRPI